MEAMLKEIVDETSLGKYDFMYLRIGMSALPSLPMLMINRLRQQLQVGSSITFSLKRP